MVTMSQCVCSSSMDWLRRNFNHGLQLVNCKYCISLIYRLLDVLDALPLNMMSLTLFLNCDGSHKLQYFTDLKALHIRHWSFLAYVITMGIIYVARSINVILFSYQFCDLIALLLWLLGSRYLVCLMTFLTYAYFSVAGVIFIIIFYEFGNILSSTTIEAGCQLLLKIVNNATSFVFIFTGGWGKALKANWNLYTEEHILF